MELGTPWWGCGSIFENRSRFKQHPTLEYVWFRFLPDHVSDPFFSIVEDQLKNELHGFLYSVPPMGYTDWLPRLPLYHRVSL